MVAKGIILILLFISIAAFSQRDEKKISFEVSASGATVEGINIVNLTTGYSTKTDSVGHFKISVAANDLLVLTAVNLEYHRYIVEADDLLKPVIKIKMVVKINELAETKVNQYSHITAENLGIIPEGQKKYTQAERHLQTAGDFKPIHLLSILGGSMPVDPIINAINGRTAMIKKEIELERRARMLQKLNLRIADDHYTAKLFIPADYVEGFKIFLMEKENFTSKLMSDNMAVIQFAVATHAVEYNKLISVENK